ncbi:hypothetical protein NQ317_014724 [Molorchus minor]|uniref:NOC3-like protein n=1 Tax=Molorchus minor TaxID=1323400 RepID=A0ABQ9JJS4_9CUCU|nr:hypothetical protein NQ317_014724 [Molorchus minor]
MVIQSEIIKKKNKLIKQGVIKKNKPNKVIKQLPEKKPPDNHNNESEESDIGEDMLQMVDEDDITFLKKAITNRSYNIFNKVKYSEFTGPKPKKLKLNEGDDTLEKEYEEANDTSNIKKFKNLLPIKTKSGVIPQQIEEINEIDGIDNNEEIDEVTQESNEELDDTEETMEFSIQSPNFDPAQPISAAQLLAARNEVLRQKKIHIGTLSAGLLENPEEKVMNLKTLLNIMDEETPEVYVTVKKLVIVSLVEIFKDILPDYEIKDIKQEVKKDTLKLQKYEENLLLYYKKFLQKLEKYAYILIKKNGDSRKRTEDEITLGILGVQAMCDLLVAHPYFNFSQNIAQAVVPFLNSHNKAAKELTSTAIKTLFKEDKREEITLKILRIINNYLKNHSSNIHSEMLEVLLVLRLKDVNLNQEKEQDIKQKKLMAHKSRIMQLSKKRKKEITKIVFNIYFRILKNSSGNTKVLAVCLEGLAKFSHCINLEFYIDIVNVLDQLLKEDWLGYKEKLFCIQTVFAILSGQGEVLNIDPTRFYNSLYKDLFSASTLSKKSDTILTLLKTLNDAIIKRRKKITNNRSLSFVKKVGHTIPTTIS